MKISLVIYALFIALFGCAQFHTLTLPEASPAVSIKHQIGVTTLTINFHSPSVKGRDVWNNPNVIPQKGDPIAWRAGANENTTISFDTDVFIEGQPLKAGSYGFHIIPDGHKHTLIFAQPDNLWGSYYLDIEKDAVLKVNVSDSASAFTENLSYSLIQRTQNTGTIALLWGNRMIPFKVSVDLNKTTVEKLRYELNGENTYHWQAWNDAALWCLQHNTNLEEALTWTNRSIKGGYGGFAAHNSFINLSTKIELLDALGKSEELEATIATIFEMEFSADEAHYMGATLLRLKMDKEALKLMNTGLDKHENDWGMLLFKGVSLHYLGETKKAQKTLKTCSFHCPEWFKPRLESIQNEMTSGTYNYPNRKA